MKDSCPVCGEIKNYSYLFESTDPPEPEEAGCSICGFNYIQNGNNNLLDEAKQTWQTIMDDLQKDYLQYIFLEAKRKIIIYWRLKILKRRPWNI